MIVFLGVWWAIGVPVTLVCQRRFLRHLDARFPMLPASRVGVDGILLSVVGFWVIWPFMAFESWLKYSPSRLP